MDEVVGGAHSIDEKLQEVADKSEQLKKKRSSFRLPPPDAPAVTLLVKEALELRARQDEAIPLLLRSIKSDRAGRGKRAIRGLRVETIAADEGLFCIDGTRANFTFWNQYPIWAQVFRIPRMSGASQVKLSLLLEGRCVWESEVVSVEAPVVFRAEEPIRFRRARLLVTGPEGATRLCITNPDVSAPARIE
jgi:hypothetical protein